MATFTQEQYNFAHLVMYVGRKGPRVLKKYVIDELFRYQLLKEEVSLREKLDSSKISSIYPNDKPVSSLDKLKDAEVFDVSTFVFNIPNNLNDNQELRRRIYVDLEGPIFCAFMQDREERFRKKNKQKKLLSRNQLGKLFPPGENININELDITAFCFILFEGFNCLKPVTDLDKFPGDSDMSARSDILRIKLCRNSLAHNPDAEISNGEFGRLWECMTKAFERLTGDATYRQEGDRLKCERPHMDIMDRLGSVLKKWRKDDRDEHSEHFKQITQTISCASLHTENVIRDSAKEIISVVKKYATCKPQPYEWHHVYIKDLSKFKAVCEREGIKYRLPDDSSTENSISSCSSSTKTTSPGSSQCDHDERVLQPQLTEASQSRQRRGYFFNEKDEAELSRFSYQVPYVGTSVYGGTNSISTGYYTATATSSYGNTERGETNSALYANADEVYEFRTGDCGYEASMDTSNPGSDVYPTQGHHPIVPTTDMPDRNTYGFIPSSRDDAHTQYTIPEQDIGETYIDIGTVSRMQNRHTSKSIWQKIPGARWLKCITSQGQEQEQPVMKTSSMYPAGRGTRHGKNNHGGTASTMLEEPYAVHIII